MHTQVLSIRTQRRSVTIRMSFHFYHPLILGQSPSPDSIVDMISTIYNDRSSLTLINFVPNLKINSIDLILFSIFPAQI